MAWTEERVEILKKLWAEGLSASQIANRLGGVTRNAVIGKVHRLGLSGRATTSRSKPVHPRKTRAPRKPATAPAAQYQTHGNAALKTELMPVAKAKPELLPNPLLNPIEELVIPPEERATIMTLKEHMCRWPIGDPCEEGFHFCGRNKVEDMPYCEFHARKAYQPVQARRREGKQKRAAG